MQDMQKAGYAEGLMEIYPSSLLRRPW